jgi:hypothetical protein
MAIGPTGAAMNSPISKPFRKISNTLASRYTAASGAAQDAG